MEHKEEDKIYTHVLKYTSIFGGVQGLNILMSLLRNKLVAVLLGPGGMGLASLFNTVLNFISQATTLGISFSAVRHISEYYDAGDGERLGHFVKVIRGWTVLTALLGAFVCVALGPVMSNFTFSWGDHTLHFVLLAPAVATLAVTGGEMAILKGVRRLKALAVVQVVTITVSLLCSAPVFYFFGESGIVPVITITSAVTMFCTLRYSNRIFPFRIRGAMGILGEGMEMCRLGVAFTLAGVMGSGAEMLVRSFLNVQGGLNTVGLYNAAYMLTVTYAGIVFSAMETDYFPRLSAVNHDAEAVRTTVNRQIEVSLLLTSPMLVAFIFVLPVIIPLLYSSSFSPVVSMAQVAVFAMFMKSVSLPVAYVTLAKGHSKAYFALETVYDVLLVVMVGGFFLQFGLYGTGLALALLYVIDLMVILLYAYFRYGFSLSAQVCRYAMVQLPLGLLAYLMTLWLSGWQYWLAAAVIVTSSVVFSGFVLHKKTSLWTALKKKILKK